MARRPSLTTIMTLVLAATLGGSGLADEEGWASLFDGKVLDGWTVNGGTAGYKVEDGSIVGTTVEGSPNTFLCKGDFKDFVLELEVKCDPRLNSGVQVRSHVYEKDTPQESDQKRFRKAGTVYGPQCEIAEAGRGVSGNFWDEARRTRWLDDFADRPQARTAFKDGEWNRYRIVVRGTATARGSTACPVPTSRTTGTRWASSASRSTPSRRARRRIRSAGGTSASRS
jgi:hypothetical protein